ncbi:cytochrome c oxidase subunit I [Sulfobacillus harzensis]|uniref:Cytochrome C oxidase subunit I n=1 Tax=Sulfobacillus harzensis TaxID=2729629 RepID=A0A7Y0Q125_9FIRM|nr:cbb3-type cytochrome c oxidase subunit I [Sulfobacillus harzensis]NMP20855.1 cytochrome C oxidase subunit I [Sulfobacillus harzensis]
MAQRAMVEDQQPTPEVPDRRIMPPVLRGLLWALIGFLVLDALTVLFDYSPNSPYISQVGAVAGWFGALVGWLLGVGGYEHIIKPMLGHPDPGYRQTGWRRYFQLADDHKVIGIQYLTFSTGTFLIAGLIAMAMRFQLMNYRPTLFQYPQSYLNAVGIHGTLMMFTVATVAMFGGLGNYMVPLMIGARETVFSKASGIGVWLVPAGVLTVAFSPLLGAWTTGWRGYEPLAASDGVGMFYYYLGVFALTMSSLIVALNLVTTIIFKRTKGLTWNRLPLFVWGMLTVGLLTIIWFPEIQTTFLLATIDKMVPMNMFNALGHALGFSEFFWLFGHPEVYIVVVPALAMWNEIIPVMTRKSLFARPIAVLGLVFVMMLSGMVWAHHMFTNMRYSEMLPFSFFTEMISIPTGFAYLAAIGTMWNSRMRITTPMLFVLMSMYNFFIGGITGLFVADVPANLQLHNTFWVVGHFHFTIIGGMVFTWLAAMYYWLPKFSGRTYNEFWGKLGAIWVFVAFNATFMNFFVLGLRGMNRWVGVYPPYLQTENFWTSIAAFFLGAGFGVNLVHIVWAWVKGPKVQENPWQAKTLEWQTSSPPPRYNFEELPVVVAGFYNYGEGAPEPVVAAKAGSQG